VVRVESCSDLDPTTLRLPKTSSAQVTAFRTILLRWTAAGFGYR
jgi:hypothetical protein